MRNFRKKAAGKDQKSNDFRFSSIGSFQRVHCKIIYMTFAARIKPAALSSIFWPIAESASREVPDLFNGHSRTSALQSYYLT